MKDARGRATSVELCEAVLQNPNGAWIVAFVPKPGEEKIDLVYKYLLRVPNTNLAVGVNARTGTKTPVFHPLLTNTAAMLAGARRYYNRIGRSKLENSKWYNVFTKQWREIYWALIKYRFCKLV